METNLTLNKIDFVPWISRFFKTVGFVAVAVAVIAVCNARLESLRNAQNAMPPGYVTAAEQTRQLECLTRNIYWKPQASLLKAK